MKEIENIIYNITEDIQNILTSTREDGSVNIVDALFAISDSINHFTYCLTFGNASTNGWGAMESMTKEIKEALDSIASSIGDHNV